MIILKFGRRKFLAGLTFGAAGIAALRAVLPTRGSFVSQANAAENSGAGRLTLHAIDTYFGQTRPGLRIDVSVLQDGEYQLIKTVETLQGGRTEAPVLEAGELQGGRYELLLHLADYFQRLEADLPDPPFLTEVPIRFGVFDASQNFHVPILFSPWNYSYYRGS